MEDYKTRGKNVDVEYAKFLAEKKSGKKTASPIVAFVVPKPEPKPTVVIPPEIVGKKVKHKKYGVSTITAINNTIIAVDFEQVGLKKMEYMFCKDNKILDYI